MLMAIHSMGSTLGRGASSARDSSQFQAGRGVVASIRKGLVGRVNELKLLPLGPPNRVTRPETAMHSSWGVGSVVFLSLKRASNNDYGRHAVGMNEKL